MAIAKYNIPGQLVYSNEDFNMNLLNFRDSFECFLNVIDEMSDDAESYLEKGERIISLAKEKYKSFLKKHQITDADELLYSVPVSENGGWETTCENIAKKVIRPLVSSCKDFKDEREYAILKELIDFDFKIEPATDTSVIRGGAYRKLLIGLKKTNDIVKVTIKEKGFPDVEFYGYRAYKIPEKQARYIWKDMTSISDVGYVLAFLVMLTQYNRYIDNVLSEGKVKDFSKEDIQKLDGLLEYAVSANSGILPDRYVGFKKRIFEEPRTCADLVQDFNIGRRISKNALSFIKKIYGIDDIPVYEFSHERLKKDNGRKIRDTSGTKPFKYVLTKDVDWVIYKLNPLYAAKLGIRLHYNDFLGWYTQTTRLDTDSEFYPYTFGATPHCIRCFNPYSDADSFLFNIIKRIWEEKGEIVKTLNHYKELEKSLSGSHASVFQTKKQISKKTLNAMENCIFNDYFGYVEIDNDCDLSKIDILGKEFSAFMKERMNKLVLSDYQLRFRKLGNYKALGLFFPSLGCLCVDISSPSSMLHELGHLIDYNNGALSEKAEFMPVYNSYKSAFYDGLWMATEEKRKQMEGKSKYNASYYLKNTEVFARCFEMYMYNEGVRTSFSKDSFKHDAIEYPATSEYLMKLVKEYFDRLMENMHDSSIKALPEAA